MRGRTSGAVKARLTRVSQAAEYGPQTLGVGQKHLVGRAEDQERHHSGPVPCRGIPVRSHDRLINPRLLW
jgi:hypothetical protein